LNCFRVHDRRHVIGDDEVPQIHGSHHLVEALTDIAQLTRERCYVFYVYRVDVGLNSCKIGTQFSPQLSRSDSANLNISSSDCCLAFLDFVSTVGLVALGMGLSSSSRSSRRMLIGFLIGDLGSCASTFL